MEDATWRENAWGTQGPMLVKEGEALRLDVLVPWQASRWLEIPMPPDASPVPWRTKVTWQRDLTGAERILAEHVEKLGFKYPWRRRSNQYLELGP